MNLKKLLTLGLTLALTLSLTACGGQKGPYTDAEPDLPAEEDVTAPPAEEDAELPVTTRIAALKGPTAMGLVKLMEDAQESAVGPLYNFTLAASADEVTPLLIKGELDMACVPANLASVLYQKTGGNMQVLAVNTLGVLYLVETGDTVQSMADLKGRTIAAAGKGSTPEYALRYLLTENGIDPDRDVTIDWRSEHSECVAALAAGQASIALLPQPFVTAAQAKIESLRTALDLTAEWAALDNGSELITGVIVARREFVEEHPAAVSTLLEEYAASVNWVNEHTADAADLIVKYGIVESAAVAEQALPHCNIVCITDTEMETILSGYLQVLFDADPAAVGGALPDETFYFVSGT